MKKINLIKISVIAVLSVVLSACVVAPPQPIGYRITSPTLPTYVNGQYVGMQPSNYVAPVQGATTEAAPVAQNSEAAPVAVSQASVANTQQVAVQQAPVYLPSLAPSVVYVQAPAPVYAPTYYPSYYGSGYYPYGNYSYGGYPSGGYSYGAYPYGRYSYGGYPYSGFSPWFGGVGIGIGFRGRIR